MQRISKTLSRAGIASRREAEKLVLNGSVRVNGLVINTPVTKVSAFDRITVNGKLVNDPENTRLWRYHKPVGLVTSNSDEQGRVTVYDKLPPDLPRLMSIGRLDMTSEGLLLLTNDGGLKRYMELPSTGFLRKYKVRVNGVHNENLLDKLRTGIFVNDERFKPIEVSLNRIKGSNVWYDVVLSEGRNREIRRAFKEINMMVNRLIRTAFGIFELGVLPKGAIEEVHLGAFLKDLNFEEESKREQTD